MIVNYRVSTKTRAPFCGLACCGNHFGRCERSCYANVHHNNRKRAMRRYANHVERFLVRREIQNQLIEQFEDCIPELDETNWFDFDANYNWQNYRAESVENEFSDADLSESEYYEYLDDERERIDSRDIDETLDREHWIREGELRDEYYSNYEE